VSLGDLIVLFGVCILTVKAMDLCLLLAMLLVEWLVARRWRKAHTNVAIQVASDRPVPIVFGTVRARWTPPSDDDAYH